MKRPLQGTISVIPDKSMTHRGVLLGCLAEGVTELRNPNPGADCLATLRVAEQLGAGVRQERDRWIIEGGRARLTGSDRPLDFGNSGTGMRLFAGMIAGLPIEATLTGDGSLRKRPMGRIIEPLTRMGARIDAEQDATAPLHVRGGDLRGFDYDLPIASAQVKSAILLAGLSLTKGQVRLKEPGPSRDHTERLLAHLGAPIEVDRTGNRIVLGSPSSLRARDWTVAGDFSAATFYLVAATIVPGSEVRLEGVGLNPTRTGALDLLRRMGADITVEPDPDPGPEPIGSLIIRSASLTGVQVGGEEIGRLIDEVPVLAVAAAMAEGETRFDDIGELRVKESDRIASTCELLQRLGVEVEEDPGSFTVRGQGRLRGGRIDTRSDHRIAMSALVADCAAESSVEIDSPEMIATSDPFFVRTLEELQEGKLR